MEEKERYELRIYAGCESYSITDTKEKQQLTIENVINLLNQQDKRIKELEETLVKARQREIIIHQNYRQGYAKDYEEMNNLKEEIEDWREENQQLKKQLEESERLVDRYKNWHDDVVERNKQLKQQVEEKEKRIHEVENTFNVSSIALADKFKKIKELKLQLAESKEENKKLVKALNGDIFINYKVPMENAKLKQQLRNLPKKIVEEIRKEIELPLYVHPDFDEFECVFDIDKLLDTILKKYGG